MSVLDIIFSLLWLIVLVGLPFWLIGFDSRGLSEWLGSRAAAKVLAHSPDSSKSRLMPESTFVVEITETAECGCSTSAA